MMRKTLVILTLAAVLLAACNPAATPQAATATPLSTPTDRLVPTVAPTDTLSPTATPKPTVEPTTEPEPAPRVFIDDLGREVPFVPPARAIVALGPSILESLFAIGAGDQVVGREEFSTYPEEALDIPSVGSLFGDLPAEAILALEPDLVIAPEIISPEQVQALEGLGLNVFWQANPTDFESLYANLAVLGALTGHELAVESLVSDLAERVRAVEMALAPVEFRPKVFYELDATDPLNPFTAGAGTFIDTIITMAGGFNIGAALPGEYAQMSSEEIILQNPDVIILGDAPYGVTPESVAGRAGWETIAAVQNSRVYPFDPFLVSVPGPRLVDGLEAMAALLHPEVFK